MHEEVLPVCQAHYEDTQRDLTETKEKLTELSTLPQKFDNMCEWIKRLCNDVKDLTVNYQTKEVCRMCTDNVEKLEQKLDRLQFWLMTTAAGVVVSIVLAFLFKFGLK